MYRKSLHNLSKWDRLIQINSNNQSPCLSLKHQTNLNEFQNLENQSNDLLNLNNFSKLPFIHRPYSTSMNSSENDNNLKNPTKIHHMMSNSCCETHSKHRNQFNLNLNKEFLNVKKLYFYGLKNYVLCVFN